MGRPKLYPKVGETVVIPRGAKIVGTHPNLPKTSGRLIRVSVAEFDRDTNEVWWLGASGYWHGTSEWRWLTREELIREAALEARKAS